MIDYIKKNHLGLLIIVFLIVSSFGGAKEAAKQYGAINRDTTTISNPFTFQQGITNDSTLTQTGAATLSSTATIGGKLTTNAGHLRSYTNSTSTTATSQTLAVADILNYDTILMTPNTGALTLTFPASSTMTTLVPTAGDMQETCIFNATSTAAATITLATGTGLSLERVATSTTSGSAGMLAIPANGSACMKFVRQKATSAAFDISILVTPFLGAE